MGFRQRGVDLLEQKVVRLIATREMHGFEVVQSLRAGEALEGGASSDPSAGSIPFDGAIYPVLRRLERRGVLQSHWVDAGDDRPRLRYYLLTPHGARVAARPFLRSATVTKAARP